MDRFKIISAVYLVLKQDDTVLLLRRSGTGYHDGEYSLPAGHVDGGESLKKAMLREAKEEIGVILETPNLSLVHVAHRSSDLPNNINERLDFFFECNEWKGDIENMEPSKCSALTWASINDLPPNIIPRIQDILKMIENRQNYSAENWEI